jgi:arylsulfatase A-like enzyme
MKAVMLMFDSLNRGALPAWGGKQSLPQFERLARQTARFSSSYICSMPCMPARRDFHTGRPSFLFRGWGPLEPFDFSVPGALKEAGIYTHFVTDHYHYWEHGGATYHTPYHTHRFIRGQEGDGWVGQVRPPTVPATLNFRNDDRNTRLGSLQREDWVNRQFLRRDEDFPMSQTISAGLDFLARNASEDNWFLHLETFDPHEPFVAPPDLREKYGIADVPVFDWPSYGRVTETPEEIELLRRNYAALVEYCDRQLGRVLDAFDRHGLWDDTMLIVWTDHGFLLGEHECLGKVWCPFYQEIANTPFFVWDPRSGAKDCVRNALVQPAIDIGPTLLRWFDQPIPDSVRGRDLQATVAEDAPVRDAAIFGCFGLDVNVTDGKHVYMRQPEDPTAPAFLDTLMPTHMRSFFSKEQLNSFVEAAERPYTNGCIVPRYALGSFPWAARDPGGHRLYDIQSDPGQSKALSDGALESRLCGLLVDEMRRQDAPDWQFKRLGLGNARKL